MALIGRPGLGMRHPHPSRAMASSKPQGLNKGEGRSTDGEDACREKQQLSLTQGVGSGACLKNRKQSGEWAMRGRGAGEQVWGH